MGKEFSNQPHDKPKRTRGEIARRLPGAIVKGMGRFLDVTGAGRPRRDYSPDAQLARAAEMISQARKKLEKNIDLDKPEEPTLIYRAEDWEK